jgi:lipoic acid synthetase
VHELLQDLSEHGVQIVTIGQYLRPSLKHHPLVRFWHPDEFDALRSFALGLGFAHVESGPLVRSSYHAAGQALAAAG